MIKILKALGNGIVTLFNLVVIGSIIAVTAFATGTTIMSADEEVHLSQSVEVIVPDMPNTSERVDIEYFLIDPHKYEQEFCLAQNVFFESSVDNKAGMAGVADVTLNQMVGWEMMHNGTLRGISDGSTHYHATNVKPIWRKDVGMALVGRIGSHIFYRWN